MSSPTTFTFRSAKALPGSDRLSRPMLGTVRFAVRHLWDVTVEGLENIPVDGPAIITPNHLSFCDSVFIPAVLPRRSWAIGKAEYLDSWKTRHLFPAMGMIPVDRSGGKAALRALDIAADVLDAGHLFMIYPEGTRSRSGFLHRGRTGAARLAARCDAPIIPVGHVGTLDIQPPDAPLMKTRLPVTIKFGAPMFAEDFGYPDDPRALRTFTDAVMYEISSLSGQKYVHQYASSDDKPGVFATPPKPKISVPPGRNGSSEPEADGPIDVRDELVRL